MGEQVGIGSLVSFVTIETRIDTIEPMGLRERKLITRLYTSGDSAYLPGPSEMGLVVGGPEWPESGGKVRLWEVLVGGGKWWFDEEHLLISLNS